MAVIAVDFEASCLPQYGRSFPIEVGIASTEGWSRSWLIRPHADWADWQWSEEAESLHGISRAQLERDGLDARCVARQLRAAVAGHEVIADSYFDDAWSRTLFAAAGEATHLPIRCLAELRLFHDTDRTVLTRLLDAADRQRARRHRAEDDARWLAQLMAGLIAESDMARPAARAA
ncbi:MULTISPECIES: hypothetical protein [unclassified Sphingobium]|uniref:3'-5' exonuclease n=1 Tax=unclassified Sphingobium TaxID=2611147 RepID=UPI002224D22B|nr:MULTISPECIES: hypothetical protein [unclassified Sphingobium]MCW2411813.1 DNA polymerase III epsilon subunit-like protein [Sphingobium sp. B8D3D]MCW2415889.1 DNA polymerase III epsilon subunit-like protein [Sphingobium sp. B8D3A]